MSDQEDFRAGLVRQSDAELHTVCRQLTLLYLRSARRDRQLERQLGDVMDEFAYRGKRHLYLDATARGREQYHKERRQPTEEQTR